MQKKYTLAAFLNRGSDSSRITQIELFDMQTSTNNSSAGATVSGNYVRIDADNTNDGFIGRWDDITLPAGNTTLRLRISRVAGSATFPSAFYIKENDL